MCGLLKKREEGLKATHTQEKGEIDVLNLKFVHQDRRALFAVSTAPVVSLAKSKSRDMISPLC